jgi:hypothetical protein
MQDKPQVAFVGVLVEVLHPAGLEGGRPAHHHPPAYEARIDGAVPPQARKAARVGGPSALHAAERAAVAGTQAALARDLVAAIAAARRQVGAAGPRPAGLARRVRALAALRAWAVA